MTKTDYRTTERWLDPTEFDPCIAAERRMEKSHSSAKRWCCLLFILMSMLIVVGAVVYLVASDNSVSDYDVQEMKSDGEFDSSESKTSDYVEQQTVPSKRVVKPVVIKSRTPFTTPTSLKMPHTDVRKIDTKPYRVSADGTKADCGEFKSDGYKSGLFHVQAGSKSVVVQCDMETAGRSWTIFHKRIDGEIEFYNRTWEEYKNGFGRPDTSYWMGLENLYQMMPKDGSMLRLRIELHGDFCASQKQCSGQSDGFWTGEWDFKIGAEMTNYVLQLSKVKDGNLSTVLDYFHLMHDGRPFTTFDRDNDKMINANCAVTRNFGGWWHNDCGYMALNGMYGDTAAKRRYQYWYHQENKISYYIHPKKSIMMFRTLN